MYTFKNPQTLRYAPSASAKRLSTALIYFICLIRKP